MHINLFTIWFFYFIQSITTECTIGNYCNDLIPCSSNGNCFPDLFQYYRNTSQNKTALCRCKIGYVTRTTDTIQCCYKQKKQFIAFLLELCINLGMGHFYYGNIALGVIKLLVFLFLFIIIACSYCFLFYSEMIIDPNKEMLSTWIINGCLIIYVIATLIDLFLLGLNFYVDENGVPLQPW